MSDYELAPSIDALVDGATRRVPLTSGDSKSGARLERIEIGSEWFVLKYVDRRDDWLMRQAGDVSCWPVRVWECGVLALVPPSIDHTIVGAARTGDGTGAVLMRDAGAWLVPADDRPIDLEQHLRFLAHLATFHAATWEWHDDVGLLPLGNRYAFFAPESLACEEALGWPAPVPTIARDGWMRLDEVAPAMAAQLAPLRIAPWPLVEALTDGPHAFLHGDWKLGNLGSHPDGRTVLVDWSLPGEGPPLVELAHYLALNRARLPEGHSKDDAIVAYRDALENEGVVTDDWWDRQLALCLLGVMVQLGWEKALGAADDREWWAARVDEGVAWL